MLNKQVIIKSGSSKGMIGNYIESKTINGQKMAIIEMDCMYQVAFPIEDIDFLESVDIEK